MQAGSGKYFVSIVCPEELKLTIDVSSFMLGSRQSLWPPKELSFSFFRKSSVSVSSPGVPALPPLVAGLLSYHVYSLSGSFGLL